MYGLFIAASGFVVTLTNEFDSPMCPMYLENPPTAIIIKPKSANVDEVIDLMTKKKSTIVEPDVFTPFGKKSSCPDITPTNIINKPASNRTDWVLYFLIIKKPATNTIGKASKANICSTFYGI